MRELLKYLKPYWKQVLLVIILLTLQAISNLFLPTLNAAIVNEGIAKGNLSFIIRTGGIMLLVTLLLAFSSVFATYFSSKIASYFGRDLRKEIYYKALDFSQSDTDSFGTASLITRNTNDVFQVQRTLLMILNIVILAPILAIGGIFMAIQQDVVLSISVILIVPIMGIFIFCLLKKAVPFFKAMQIKLDKVNRILREKLIGIRVIRAFVKEDYEEKRFDNANQDLTQTALKVNRLLALTIPLLMLIMNIASVSLLWFGAIRIESGAMPIGNLIAFITYVMEILIAVIMVMAMFVMLPRAQASADRIFSVLDKHPEINDPKKPSLLKETKGEITFRNVTFRYDNAEEPVIKNISFTAEPGKTTAIIGGTGCGKSTIVNLIPRFYDVTQGRIELDGVNIKQITLRDLRKTIGLIPQKAYLFSGTIASNLMYGKQDATDEEIWKALEIAQAKDFVSKLPKKLESTVDQGGTNFSGGQRQRLAIARAIVKNPKIYLFDDSFSALDNKTDAKLRKALKEEIKDATIIIVSQKVSSILGADQIIVMNDDGTVAGIGKHKELLKSCNVYRDIVYSQIPLEELK